MLLVLAMMENVTRCLISDNIMIFQAGYHSFTLRVIAIQGFQDQKGAIETVEGELKKAIGRGFQSAGRTDKVHALSFELMHVSSGLHFKHISYFIFVVDMLYIIYNIHVV